jgi:hypothetical protein
MKALRGLGICVPSCLQVHFCDLFGTVFLDVGNAVAIDNSVSPLTADVEKGPVMR